MHLYITGFLPDDFEDSSLKYDLDIKPEFEKTVMKILGWESLAAESDGDLPLTNEQTSQIALAIKEPLPHDLDLFIGVVT